MVYNMQQQSATQAAMTRHTVASPGFVARRGKVVSLVMRHSRWTSGPGAAAARWLIVLRLMQHWSKELRVGDICTSWSCRLHNTWIVGSQIWSKVNYNEIVESRGGHMPQCPIAGDATAAKTTYRNSPTYWLEFRTERWLIRAPDDSRKVLCFTCILFKKLLDSYSMVPHQKYTQLILKYCLIGDPENGPEEFAES